MSFYLAAVAKRFPKFAPYNARIVAKDIPTDTLREELYARRFEYWYRKLESIPGTIDAAKVQACQVKSALANPTQLTYRQIATGMVWAVQIVGCFCIGEMIARRDIRGYDSAVGVTQEAHH